MLRMVADGPGIVLDAVLKLDRVTVIVQDDRVVRTSALVERPSSRITRFLVSSGIPRHLNGPAYCPGGAVHHLDRPWLAARRPLGCAVAPEVSRAADRASPSRHAEGPSAGRARVGRDRARSVRRYRAADRVPLGLWVVPTVYVPLILIGTAAPILLRRWQLRHSVTEPAGLDSSAEIPPTA